MDKHVDRSPQPIIANGKINPNTLLIGYMLSPGSRRLTRYLSDMLLAKILLLSN